MSFISFEKEVFIGILYVFVYTMYFFDRTRVYMYVYVFFFKQMCRALSGPMVTAECMYRQTFGCLKQKKTNLRYLDTNKWLHFLCLHIHFYKLRKTMFFFLKDLCKYHSLTLKYHRHYFGKHKYYNFGKF